MKIGYFTSIEGWGGSEMYLLRLMQGVRERGHEVVLFGIKGTRLWDEAGAVGIERVAWREVAGCSLQVAGNMLMGSAEINHREHKEHRRGKDLKPRAKSVLLRCVPGWFKLIAGNVREVLHLRRLFKQHPVDVMHVNVHGYEVAGVACQWCGIPTVGVYCISPEAARGIQACLIRWTAKIYRAVICKSPSPAEEWRRQYHVPVTHVIRNGVDTRIFARASGSRVFDSNELDIAFAGRLAYRKGVDVLIKAIAGLGRNAHVHCSIAGDGDQKGILQELVEKSQVGDKIDFCGHVEDMPAFYARHQFFVAVTRETWAGSIVLEAMSSGLIPIVGNADVVQDGVTGFVCEDSTPECLASVLQKVYALPLEEKQAMSEKIRLYAVEHFDNERMYRETLDAYCDSMKKGATVSP